MSSPPEPLLSVRSAVVALIAVLAGLLAGVLAYLGGANVAAAVLVGGGALAVVLPLVHSVLVQE